ncbi:four-carbon acid sugar kinase family protein [Lacticaseibacillus sp. GG6-2]
MKKYLIIADDFTGANDTGVQLADVGLDVNVRFVPDSNSPEAMVIDTETRNASGQEAQASLQKLAAQIPLSQYQFVVKKVDSTLRGNIAVEIRALAEIMEPDVIVFAPGLPDARREIRNGELFVDNVPGSKTDFAKDPLKPIVTDDIRELMQQAFPDQTIHLHTVNQIRKSDFTLGVNHRYCVFDTKTNDDLERIVDAATSTGKRILWVGSAGLMRAMLATQYTIKPALALIGSVSAVTRKQLHIAEENGIKLINIPIYQAYIQGTYKTYVDQAMQALRQGKDVVLMSSASYQRSEVANTLSILKANGVPANQANGVIQNVLSGICRQVLLHVATAGVFISGGETAKGLLNISKAVGARVLYEIAPGIPMMDVVGGEFDGLPMITKAGAFGEDRLILYAFKKLKCRKQSIS